MKDDLKCPYCGQDLEVKHDSGDGYDENVKHEMECKYCQKKFVFETTVTYSYYPHKADCLNDGNHKWYLPWTNPKTESEFCCKDCYETRQPTIEEWREILKDEKPDSKWEMEAIERRLNGK